MRPLERKNRRAGVVDTYVYEGGVRVTCYIRWPAGLPAGADDGPAMAHIDVMPTVLAACGVGLSAVGRV